MIAKHSTTLFAIAAVAGAAALCLFFFLLKGTWNRTIVPEQSLSVAGETVLIAVADTPQERERGLGGTTHLAPNEGMLFVFDRDDQHSFWMRDMRYSIDIIWISREKRVVYIEFSVSPNTFPQTFTPPTPARYVLEVPAGFAEAHRVRIGSDVAF